MRMTMSRRDVKAIEKGMEKYNTNSKGLLQIVNEWIEQEKDDMKLLLHYKKCIETYIAWEL